MCSFPFFLVDADFLRPPRTSELSNLPPTIVSLQNRSNNARMNPFSLHRDEAVASLILPNLNEVSVDPIFEAVKQNDKNGLIEVLKKQKTEPLPLLADNQKWTALHLAASKSECNEYLALLFQHDSCDIIVHKDNQTNLGETALHIACKYGCEENVLILLENGCDIEKKTATGYTALDIAISKGYGKIVQYLLNFGANIDSRDETGCTPLHLSALAGHPDVTDILLASGASILSVDDEGNLPLHQACRSKNFETVRLLLKHNSAHLNRQNSDGITPFMLAVGNFDAGCIQYLLENGAQTDIRDNCGRMAFHFATSLDRIESFSCFIKAININRVKINWFYNIASVLRFKQTCFPYTFDSYTCLIIPMGVDCLNVLVKSHLPQSMLQMPSLRRDCVAESIRVFSPLAYLFFHHAETGNEEFDGCLDLLLKHKISVTDEFQRVFRTDWLNCGLQFINPLSLLLCSRWPNNREHYFNKLIENNVTTDYCLQSFHNNDKAFETFNRYKLYYSPVLYAVENYNLEVVKLLISNSAILEPDVLCNYLIVAFTRKIDQSAEEEAEARNLYQYLIYLKPVYFKWHQHWQSFPFVPAAEKICGGIEEIFQCDSYNFQQSPIFAVAEEQIGVPRSYQTSYDRREFPYIFATEEFTNVKLKQLCRTVIRQQLRGRTLEDNLRNFRRRILELPLPNEMKNYLLFKDDGVSHTTSSYL